MSGYGSINIAMTKDLTLAERTVWQYLYGRANGARVCWPALGEIAADIGLTKTTIIASTKKLQSRGFIRIQHRYRDTNNYHMLDVPWLHERPAYCSIKPAPAEPIEAADVGLSKAESIPDLGLSKAESTPHRSSANLTPQGDLELNSPDCGVKQSGIPSIYQEANQGKKEPSFGGKSACAPATPSNVIPIDRMDSCREIVGAWNAMASDRGLPKVASMPRQRVASLSKRIKEVGLDQMRVAIEAVRASSFCAGANDRGWVASFDFVLQPKSLTKLLEGCYADRMPRAEKRSKFDQIHNELGTRSLWLDDDEPQPALDPGPPGLFFGGNP